MKTYLISSLLLLVGVTCAPAADVADYVEDVQGCVIVMPDELATMYRGGRLAYRGGFPGGRHHGRPGRGPYGGGHYGGPHPRYPSRGGHYGPPSGSKSHPRHGGYGGYGPGGYGGGNYSKGPRW